jgi:glycosidase
MSIHTPDWVKHAVFYQIFPDRFARSSRLDRPRGIELKPWGSPPQEQGFQGGDLLGIVDKLDYLEELGITALYLNPIFASAANHRYHTYDYFQVDPLLGGNAALRELLDQAHARNIRVILDGVFNHASRGFWAFHHILENGPKSPYLDWFIVRGWPLRPYASTPKRPAQEWLQGDRFDAVMNYPFSRAVLGFFGADTLKTDYKPGGFELKPLNAPAFADEIDRMHALYDWRVNQVQLNLLDSHDTARTLWIVAGDQSALRLCVLFQMTMPGAPCIYYGDEIGMNGAADPHCRAAFPWTEQSQWHSDLLTFYHRAIALRHRYLVLRIGTFQRLLARDGVYAFSRTLKQQHAVVIFNTNARATHLNLKVAGAYQEQVFEGVWNDGRYQVRDGQLQRVRIPPRDATVLVSMDS